MSQNQPEPNEEPEEDDDELEPPGAWLLGMFADMGMLGPEIEDEEELEE
jgi:hypothetical protein